MRNHFILVVILVFTGLAFSQVRNIDTKADVNKAKEQIEKTSGLVDPPAMMKALQRGTFAATEKVESFGAGDIPTFLLHCSGQYVHRGETVDCSLIPMSSSSTRYFVTGRIFKPGNSGYYDGTVSVGYFLADTSFAGLIHGTESGEFIHVQSRTFAPEDNPGWYQMDFIIYDDYGNLIQQIWVYFYLFNTGPVSGFYGIDSATTMLNTYRLAGSFPTNLPIFYMVGVPKWGYSVTGPDPRFAVYAAPGGRRLDLPARILFNYQTKLDVALWSPISRQAIIGNNVITEPATP